MGLSVVVGMLQDILVEGEEEDADDYRQHVAEINRFLRGARLPEHQESTGEDVDVVAFDFSYSDIHYLRRLAVYLARDGELPEPGGPQPAEDALVDRAYQAFAENPPPQGGFLQAGVPGAPSPFSRFTHLLNHSDAEGYYVPVDFPDVMRVSSELGELLGSTQSLFRELKILSGALEIPIDLDPESAELWEAREHPGAGETVWQRYGRESFVCQRLLQAARHSISVGALITFA